jgi:3-methyladenine DNA glycosylase AlkD
MAVGRRMVHLGPGVTMSGADRDVARFVVSRLEELGDPEVAAGQAAYMYGRRFRAMYPDRPGDPYHGVKTAGIRVVGREVRDRFSIETAEQYVGTVTALWELPHREEKYLAIGIAAGRTAFVTSEHLPLYRRLVTEGSWWDLVDGVAANCVGRVLLRERAATKPVIERWIDDDDLWIRRSALLAHLTHKDATDEAQLFDHCRRRIHEKEFFIRKAIGWALRQYARTAPDAVRAFALAHRDDMSGLSFREATKHLEIGT